MPLAHPDVAVVVLSPMAVFEEAPILQQAIIVALVAAMIAAIVVLTRKLSGARRLAGGSAFLSGLRLGAPIIGLLGACASGLNMTLAMASVPIQPTLKMFAPGIAESFLMVGIGFFVGAIAVFAHWAVEARIDRQVLSA